MNNWNIEEVLRLLAEAARIALAHFDAPVREFKRDRSLVTQADREIEAMLGKEFDHPEEQVYLIGEETVETKDESYLKEALEKTAWIIDPIDGTSSYANQLVSWGISIAFSQNGVIQEGAIYLPVVGKLLITGNGRVYFSSWRLDAKERMPHLEQYHPVVPGPPFEGGVVALDQENTRKGHGVPGTIHAIGSSVFALLHLFMGGYISYIANAKLWDLASGAAMMEKLSFLGKFEDGRSYTTRIDNSNYLLEPEAGIRRWKTRGRVVFSGSEEALTYTIEGLNKKKALT
ncbi:MAG TPA: inositol monophosphatase family protein [Spirochaetales bacterium]|nr:inositol monophosphatase family protein [Spirochaetales bacterium]